MSERIIPAEGHKTLRIVFALVALVWMGSLTADMYRDRLKYDHERCPMELQRCLTSTATAATQCEAEKGQLRARVRSDSNTACLALGCNPPIR